MVKNLLANAGDARDAGLIPGLGRSLEEEMKTLFQYSCLENSTNRGAWWATVDGDAKNWKQLGDGTHSHTLIHMKKQIDNIA